MSKQASANLLSHLNGELLTIATLWKIVCKTGDELFFTDHDEDIIYSGNTYKASTGYTRSSISSSVGLDVDQLQIEGLIDDAQIQEVDIRAGKFDYASVEISIINYNSVADGIMILRQGIFGEAQLKDSLYVVELRGLSQLFSNEILKVFTADCSADLGDSRCTIDLNLSQYHRLTEAVTAVTSNQEFTAAGMANPGAAGASWAQGYLLWTSGKNAGRTMEVKSYNNGTKVIKLFLPMPYPIQVDDEFDIFAGCDKLVATCRDVFNNLVNYRGFPFIPTVREVFAYPDASSSGYGSGGS